MFLKIYILLDNNICLNKNLKYFFWNTVTFNIQRFYPKINNLMTSSFILMQTQLTHIKWKEHYMYIILGDKEIATVISYSERNYFTDFQTFRLNNWFYIWVWAFSRLTNKTLRGFYANMRNLVLQSFCVLLFDFTRYWYEEYMSCLRKKHFIYQYQQLYHYQLSIQARA